MEYPWRYVLCTYYRRCMFYYITFCSYYLCGCDGFEIVVQYLICIAMLAILISVAPIFIPMLLFQQTQEMFDGWFKFLVYHAVFPLFIFFVVLVFGELLVSILQSAMNALCSQSGMCTKNFILK